MPLPKKVNEITPAFLSAALARNYPCTTVDTVDVADLHQGSASSLLLRLTFKDNPHALPPTVFLKGDFIDHKFTSAAAFAGEALYFTHLAGSLDGAVTQPHAYFAGLDEEGQAIVYSRTSPSETSGSATARNR